ncbi:unnamed protein product [Miscanthus lutarioriparius]|uniref:Uncharacterized protein n=1 Tax=Miscanthus lutarioriparius TaxID=422564 RepID=A0A811NFB5_9POAL|nr:unnamed protein product [Miscanthus lutarioriparius]
MLLGAKGCCSYVGLCLNWLFCSLKMHDESTKRQKVDDDVQEGALPPYLLDRYQTHRAKVLSNTIKQKRKEKAGKWDLIRSRRSSGLQEKYRCRLHCNFFIRTPAHAIMLEQEHYLGHCKDHPKDAEFLNCPIRFYTKMEAIFANAMATGKFALGSGEALGQNQADSVGAKADGPPLTHTTVPSEQGGDSKATELLPTSLAAGPKRKRGNFSEEEMLMLTNMSDAVNNVANALRETGPAHVDANLYLAVMEMPGFSEEALIVAYTFLLDNKAQGRGFVNMSDAHRALWLRTFLAKNYYV